METLYADYKTTKKIMINNVIDRTNVLDDNQGYIIETRDGRILDNTECTRVELRNAVAIEDWNCTENGTWSVFTNR